jgi:hypothetical protein
MGHCTRKCVARQEAKVPIGERHGGLYLGIVITGVNALIATALVYRVYMKAAPQLASSSI